MSRLIELRGVAGCGRSTLRQGIKRWSRRDTRFMDQHVFLFPSRSLKPLHSIVYEPNWAGEEHANGYFAWTLRNLLQLEENPEPLLYIHAAQCRAFCNQLFGHHALALDWYLRTPTGLSSQELIELWLNPQADYYATTFVKTPEEQIRDIMSMD
uniref:Uncharacterized protein n=1 Tax=viral metagenome TaxID=1070528 RepID=A0A6C0BPC1_9ZZZZ